MVLICCSFFVFILPEHCVDFFDDGKTDLTVVHHSTGIWFWCHILANLFIYSVKCDQVAIISGVFLPIFGY
jgi:hypothetical protein